MSKGVFITGTDTGVGKTLVASALVYAWAQQGRRVAGMKPVASGAERKDGGLRNDDAVRLWELTNVAARYDEINPYVFAAPVAPHLAAVDAGCDMSIDHIQRVYKDLSGRCERIVVEGVGGWLVPFAKGHTMADVAQTLALPVLMVVHIRLGCLNHALLTQAAVLSSGLKLLAWVANETTPDMELAAENIASLKERISAPLLARVPWQAEPSVASTSAILGLKPLEQLL